MTSSLHNLADDAPVELWAASAVHKSTGLTPLTGDARLTRVSGHAERLAALDMVQHWADRPCAVTLGADRGYEAADFVEELRGMNVRPHVAQNTSGRRSAIDKRTT